MAKRKLIQRAEPQKRSRADAVKKFNQGLIYVQGQLIALNSGSNDFSINLTSSGKRLLGVSVIPVSSGDISNSLITMNVNNNVLLKTVGIQNLNPNFVQSMKYFPTPQPLTGKDTIFGVILNNNVGAVNIIMNVFYESGLK